jgi:YD repeat-containing protein
MPREDLARNTGDMIESANLDTKSLSEIKIESTSGAFCTSFKLSQSYFASTETLPAKIAYFGPFTSDQKRLKLESIQEFRCNSTVKKPPYVFNYYDEANVPRRLSFSQDHWGFHNGASTNNDLMPTIWTATSVFSTSFDDNREAQWPQMRAGALRSIQYPTGGGTEFIFEPNKVKTSVCNFTNGTSVMLSINGGMADAAAGYGPAEIRNFETPIVYYYRITTSGTGSGKFFIDNTPIATVANGETKEDYIALNPGTHTFRAYGNADTGSGSGVLVSFYATTGTCVDDEKLVGGLRIKRIEQFGVNSSLRVVKSYKYDLANLYSIPVYAYKLKNEFLKTGLIPTTSLDGGCKMDGSGVNMRALAYVSPVSVHPMQTTQGYHIGYGKVTEILPDGGYTTNEFKGLLALPGGWQTLEDVCVRKIDVRTCKLSDPVFPFTTPAYDYGRGNLKSKMVFDKNNNKLSETFFTEEYQEDNIGVFGVSTFTYSAGQTSLALPTHYDIKSAKQLWQKQVNRTYNPNNVALFVETESTTEYNSLYHRFPTKVTSTTNEGSQEERITYVPDITLCNSECSGCAVNYSSQLDLLRTNYETNVELCTLGLNTGCNNLLGYDRTQHFPCSYAIDCRVASWTDYQYRLNELRKTYTNCINSCKVILSNCLTTGLANANPSVNAVFKLESKNQIAAPIESSVWNGNQLLQSSYFDYQLISDPPVDINLKKIFTTELLTPTSTFTPVVISGGNIVKDVKYSATPEASYEYDQGRIVEKTSRDGVKTSYIWGYNNAVPIVKAIGVDYANLLTAYNANPAGIRNHALMVKAQITTYQHDPVIGILSITDPNGKSQSFDYDLLGRLLRIKDNNGKIIEQYEYQYQGN